MAEEHGEQRKDGSWGPWTKLFTAFKVAMDPKKLLLAGAGIICMWLGWWALSLVFYGIASEPEWKSYQDEKNSKQAWESYKTARKRWVLLHEMAGNRMKYLEAVDVAGSLDEFLEMQKIQEAHKRLLEEVTIQLRKDESDRLKIGEKLYSFTRYVPTPPTTDEEKQKDKEREKDWRDSLVKLQDKKLTLDRIQIGDSDNKLVYLDGVTVSIEKSDKFDELKKYRQEAKRPEEIAAALIKQDPARAATVQQALLSYQMIQRDRVPPTPPLPQGRLRTWPGDEDRGANPYLFVTQQLGKTNLVSWLIHEQMPVLLEPLVKFLRPIEYFFRSDAGPYNRFYLILVILWTVATWGYFGGAITRLAAAQVTRNEKIGMMEALRFAQSRCMSYFSAPLLPLVFLAVLAVILWIFGLLEGWTFLLGDFLAVLFWPLALGMGLVMAVVLVGLLGWPLMNPTISTEGSDNFDALSRSYSYVYQAPWHYLWYGFVSLLYGAVLVFFVGFMGSLSVYMAKWGMSNAPVLSQREPTYLFIYAPKSFGWRDLLLHDSDSAKVKVAVNEATGRKTYSLADSYRKDITWHNRFGAAFVTLWLYLFFFMVVGFGYSFFWTASTIIYLLLRYKVDDTELDEINLGEEDFDEPFAPPPGAPAAPPAATPGVTMVEPPTLRPSTPPPEPPPGTEPKPPDGSPAV